MVEYPNADDALAEIASEEAEAVAALVGPMSSLWVWALVEDYVRPN